MSGPTASIFIAGYYGFGNTGDELILDAILRDLRAKVPGVRVTAMSGNPAQTAGAFGVETIDWREPHAMLRAVASADLVIVGGGGLFHDYFGSAPDVLLTSSNYGLGLFAAIALAASLQRKPLLLWNIGVGPLQTAHGRDLTGYVAQTATAITVRDADSAAILRSLGIDASKMTLASDPVFTLDAPVEPSARVAGLMTERKGDGPLIGVCLRNWEVGADTGYWTRQVAKALDEVANDCGAAFVFVPFQVGESPRENDAALAQRVIEQMQRRERVVQLDQTLEPNETLELMGKFDAVLGMRLHSMLLAALSNVPSVALSYDGKVSSFVKDLGLEAYELPIGSLRAAELGRLLKEVLRERTGLQEKLAAACGELRTRAALTAPIAAGLLRNAAAARTELSSSERMAGLAIEAQALALAESASEAARLHRDLRQHQEDFRRAASQLEQAAAEARGLLEERTRLSALVEQSGEALATARSEAAASAAKIAHLEEDLAGLQEVCRQQASQIAAVQTELSETVAKLRQDEARNQQLEKELASAAALGQDLASARKALRQAEAAANSARAALRLVSTVDARVDLAEANQAKAALAELHDWVGQQERQIQELGSWTGKQAAHIDSLTRQIAELQRSESHAWERYQALATRLAGGPLRRCAQSALDLMQSLAPDSLRRAVRPVYLPLYRRFFPPIAPAPVQQPPAKSPEPPPAPIQLAATVREAPASVPATVDFNGHSVCPSYEPLITVVLPVWNHASVLPSSIRSVLNQTWRNLELIIVDDGSVEDLTPALRESILDDPRVRVVRRPHAGLPQTLSAGFRFAQGDFLTWTSADNLMKPEMLATLVGFLLRRPDVDMVYGDMDLIDDEGRPLYHSQYRIPAQRPGATNELRLPRSVQALSLINDNFIGASFMYRAEVGRILGDYDSSLLGTEDYDYWLRIAASGRIEHVDCDRCLYSYRVHDDSLSGRHAPEIGKNAVQLIEVNRNRVRYYQRPIEVLVLANDSNRALAAVTDALQAAGHRVASVPVQSGKAERAVQAWVAGQRDPEAKLALIAELPAPAWLAAILQQDEHRIATFFYTAGEQQLDAALCESQPAWALCGSRREVAQLPTALAQSWSILPRSSLDHDELMISLSARDGVVQPWDLPVFGKPLMVYIGPVDDSIIDWDAVRNLANGYPGGTILFVSHPGRGAVDPRKKVSGRAMVEFLGEKKPEEWRPYLSCATVLLAPLRDTPQAEAAVRDIMIAYLAAGKPILATAAIGAAGFQGAPFTVTAAAASFAAAANEAITLRPNHAVIDRYLEKQSPAAFAAEIATIANEKLFPTSQASCSLRPEAPAARHDSGRPGILLETASFDRGGLEQVVLDQARDLTRRGYRVSVAITGTGGAMAEECRASGIPVHDVGPDPAAFDELLQSESPSVLITHYSNLGAPVAWRREIPSLGIIHNSYIWTTAEQDRAIREADLFITHYIAVSKTAGRFFARKYSANPNKITCIPNGTTIGNHNSNGRAPSRADLGLGAKDFVLLNVASVVGTKAQIHAIAAVQALRDEIPDLRLLCVGGENDATYGAAIREFIKDARLEEKVRMCGHTNAVADYYRVADVFLLSSLIEGWSLAKTEAMLFGLPLILTDVGGAAEVICNGDTGALVPAAYADPMDINSNNLWQYSTNRTPSNLDALIAAIREAYREREQWRAKGKLGAEKVRRQYSAKIIGDRYASEIEKLLLRYNGASTALAAAAQRTFQ